MFQKVHRRLTLLCAGITIFILFLMSLLYLIVSESGLRKSQFLSFQRDMSTLTANFEQQSVISHEWLTKLENSNSYLISIMDNGTPFLFNTRNREERCSQTIAEAFSFFQTHFQADSLISDYNAYHLEDEFTDSFGNSYYACLILLPHRSGDMEVLILSSLEEQQAQIIRQRLHFALIDICAAVALFLFSYFFTKKLLSPIEENRKEQVQFIASASHELRTPLAVILSCVGACKKASPEEEEGFLSTIQSEGMHLSHLIDDMLLLSQADNHSFHIHMQSIEPDTLILNSYESFEPMAREKRINFHISLPETTVLPCSGDSERLNQIIAILLHNAVSYTPEGGSITLALNLEETGNHSFFIISVTDNGIGIPDEDKENIFKRFYRLEKSRSDREHFGLGLCIARELLTAMHGSIHVKDTPGGGSTFLVRLPYHTVSSTQAPHPISS